MKYPLLIFCFFLTTSGVHAQFPLGWEGHWQGKLEVYNKTGLQQTIEMGLNIISESDSSWKWQIIYGSGEQAQLRDYRLIKNKKEPNQFILDEQNSIKLYLSEIHSGLYSWFGVMQNELLVSYELQADQLHFSTISSQNNDYLITGGEDENPSVTAQKVRTIQKAILTKKL